MMLDTTTERRSAAAVRAGSRTVSKLSAAVSKFQACKSHAAKVAYLAAYVERHAIKGTPLERRTLILYASAMATRYELNCMLGSIGADIDLAAPPASNRKSTK